MQDKGNRSPKASKSSQKRDFIENDEWIPTKKKMKKADWRSLMNTSRTDLKGEVPDFSEEGWARRKPKKKK